MRGKIIYILMFLLLTSVYQTEVDAKKDSNTKYTRIGAEASGNKSGDIPAYEGDSGLKCPAYYEKGEWLPNPYAGEKKLFRIDSRNVDKYADKLTYGQVARLKKNKKIFMDVYPTHRNFVFSESFYRAIDKNMTTCRLDSRHGLTGYNGGVPFPYPDNVYQMVWNIKRQYFADDVMGINEARRVVSPSGRIKKTVWTTKVINFEGRLGKPIPNPDKAFSKILAVYLYPADVAGTAMLTIQYPDDERQDDAWLYIPTLRRVRRAPSMTKGGQIDGESTIDELGCGFRGPVNDWEWKFLGKKEIYIPANCYDMYKIGTKDEDECWSGDINPDGVRWELRRVWVIEGKIKPGISHPYSKRIEYMDEDNWHPSMGDRYDRRGNLWRMYAFYVYFDYCQKFRAVVSHLYLNLESGRYEIHGGQRTKESKRAIVNSGLNADDFTVQNLRREGR